MTPFQKNILVAAFVAAVGAGIFETHQAAKLRKQTELLQAQRDGAINRLASMAEEMAKIKSNNSESLKLRQTAMLKRQTAARPTANPSAYLNGGNGNDQPSALDMGQKLGLAVVRGDAGAFDKLLAAIKAEQQSFDLNRAGLNDEQRGEVARQTFMPVNEAFKAIGDAASTGNQPALDALTRALQIPELNGLAATSLGSLAGNGDAGALEVLTHPEKYGVLLSSTISALQPAANNGSQAAIDALAAVAKNQSDRGLWYMTADSLSKAAAAGNPAAVDGLVNMSSSADPNVQDAVVQALKAAAANQNVKAAQALRAMSAP